MNAFHMQQFPLLQGTFDFVEWKIKDLTLHNEDKVETLTCGQSENPRFKIGELDDTTMQIRFV